MNIDKHFFHRQIQAFGCRLNNAYICLMRHEQVHFRLINTGAFQSLFGRPAHDPDGKFIHFFTVHADKGQAFFTGFVRRQDFRAARRDIKKLAAVAVSSHIRP